MIDILEQEIADTSEELFQILLKDRTTKKNICWATDHYVSYGAPYFPQEPITKDLVTGINTKIVQPRASKKMEEKVRRTKEKAEVFTPSWICNKQNNLIDDAWFGRKNVFNTTCGETWVSTKEKVEFQNDKTWKNYVDAKRLEISCGEAPYIVSRYDAVTGEEIPISERIGLLDRKIRIVNENTDTEEDWFKWIIRAYESTYGYEYQGDNILIARENLLYTFIENMENRFFHKPDNTQLKRIARIISWNIWQMDGITMTAPYSGHPRAYTQLSILDYANNTIQKEPIPCRIFDWRSKCSLEFRSMVKGG